MSEENFSILNRFYGRRSGKLMYQAQVACLQYVSKHLGKDIKIIQCDHERITELEERLKKAEKLQAEIYKREALLRCRLIKLECIMLGFHEKRFGVSRLVSKVAEYRKRYISEDSDE